MTKTITKGCYVATSDIKNTEQWKKVIDAFVEAGYEECEGHSSNADLWYIDDWPIWRYVGVDLRGEIIHHDAPSYYGDTPTRMSIIELLEEPTPNPPSFRIEKNLSDMADQSKIETLQEICSEGWKLGGIEPNGDYIFYREE